MSDNSLIGWTDATWPVVLGCEWDNPDCINCYAPREAIRLSANPNAYISTLYSELVVIQENGRPNWTGTIKLVPERLEWPIRWQRARKIFVCSQSDLFHKDVPFWFIGQVFDVIRKCKALGRGHVFQILTKRERRALLFCIWYQHTRGMTREEFMEEFDNVWMGFSAGHDKALQEKGVYAAIYPFKTRWLSAEPLTGPVDLGWFQGLRDCRDCHDTGYNLGRKELDRRCRFCNAPLTETNFKRAAMLRALHKGAPFEPEPFFHWVVAGGESGPKGGGKYGPGARPMWHWWPEEVEEVCRLSATEFYFKQWGNWVPVTPYSIDGEWAYYSAPSEVAVIKRKRDELLRWDPEEPPGGRCEFMAYVWPKKATGNVLNNRVYESFPELPAWLQAIWDKQGEAA